MEWGTRSSTKTSVPDPLDQLTINVSVSPDTLDTADRIETHRLQHKAPIQTISPVEAPPQPPAVTASVQEDLSTAGLSANDRKDVVKTPKPRPKYTDPNRPRPKHTNSNTVPKTERSKAIVEVKPVSPKCARRPAQSIELVVPMPDLAQRFLCDIQFDAFRLAACRSHPRRKVSIR